MAIFGEDLEKIAAEDIHELLRAWELKHRFPYFRKCVPAYLVP